MHADDFEFLVDLVARRSGLALKRRDSQKISERLAPVGRQFGFRNVGAMLSELRLAPDNLVEAVLEALSIADTAFFRDREVFEEFRCHVLPGLLNARRPERRLRIWSAGCATGQEPYSLAMLLADENLLNGGWSVELVATDLNTDAIARARAGHYSQHEVARGLGARYLVHHFAQEEDGWRINDRLRCAVDFRVFNLLEDYRPLGEFDAIFCRNVLIHFEPQAKAAVLTKLFAALAPHGSLLLGASETHCRRAA